MKPLFFAVVVCLAATTGAAAKQRATELVPGKTVACFDKVWVPPKYDVSKVLVQPAKRVYVKRRGLIELVEYAAVYREKKTLREDGYWVLKQIACKKK